MVILPSFQNKGTVHFAKDDVYSEINFKLRLGVTIIYMRSFYKQLSSEPKESIHTKVTKEHQFSWEEVFNILCCKRLECLTCGREANRKDDSCIFVVQAIL